MTDYKVVETSRVVGRYQDQWGFDRFETMPFELPHPQAQLVGYVPPPEYSSGSARLFWLVPA